MSRWVLTAAWLWASAPSPLQAQAASDAASGTAPATGATEGEAAAGDPEVAMAGEQAAKELFEAGRAAYDQGRYQEALQHFQAAYRRSPRPKLLFNIGQAADRLRMDELALESFRSYLEALPDADNREPVQNRIHALEQVLAERQADERAEQQSQAKAEQSVSGPPQPQASRPASTPQPPDAGELPLGPIITAAAGAGLMIAGGVMGAIAQQSESDYADAPVGSEQEARRARAQLDDAQNQATLANVLFGVGGASLVGAALWYWLGRPNDSQADTPGAGSGRSWLAVPLLTRDAVGISLRGAWPSAAAAKELQR